MRTPVLPVLALAVPALASDCTVTSVGRIAINDLGPGLYLNQYEGGLYPNGQNQIPPAHMNAGFAHAVAVRPLNILGNPDPAGRYVLLSIGMSNTTQEFCSQPGTLPCDPWTFMGQAATDPRVNHSSLVIANGARGGQTTSTWDSPTDPNYDLVNANVLMPQGLSEAQVQAVWVKVANAQPTISLPDPNADAFALLAGMGNIARALKVRYPHVQVVFFSSRIYAGYASTTLNPEPYAYESGFAVKWLIEAQIRQMNGGPIDPRAGDLNSNTVAPWIGWGPYLWADGLVPRSDGLTWACADVQSDGTHPSQSGEQKVGTMLLDFFLASPQAYPWFAASGGPPPCYANCDGSSTPPILNVGDFACFINRFAAGASGANCDQSTTPPMLTVADFACFINRFAAGCS
jgi:hypothetical protein